MVGMQLALHEVVRMSASRLISADAALAAHAFSVGAAHLQCACPMIVSHVVKKVLAAILWHLSFSQQDKVAD